MSKGHLSIEEIEQLSQQKGPAENQSHVENCRQCQTLLEKYRTVSAKLDQLASVRIGAKNGMNCPDERVWFDVAAGTLASDDSLRHVQHAAECESCARKLQTATRLFQEELSPEEEKQLEGLPSASTKQQSKLAQRLSTIAAPGLKSRVAPRKRKLWRQLSYPFAAAAALVLVGFLSLGFITDGLLAHGYKERGTLELRIAKAEPPKEGTRGSVEEKDRPVSLVIADLLIRLRLTINPKSARWLAEKGRLELIEAKSSAALFDLQEAHRLDPQSKTIAIDLASAYSQSGKVEDLFRAEEELLSLLPFAKDDINLLAKDPDNRLAVYNLAVLYELTGSLDQAVREWQLYLKLDADGPWALQARQRLESLRNQKHGQAPPAPSAPVSEWLTYLDSEEPSAGEAALDVALLEWLPRRRKDKELDGLLVQLALKLQREHGDDWLAEVMRTAPSPELDEAFGSLRDAIRLNAEGNFEHAVSAATRAESEFRRLDNFPGSVRAQLEQVYSHQRATEAEACVQIAGELETNLQWKNFSWIRTQLFIDRAGCLNQLGRLQEAKNQSEGGLDFAEKSSYKIVLLRAKGISASQATARGDHASALTQDVSGLREYWIRSYPVERAFQFYSDISFNCESVQLWRVTYEVDQQVVRLLVSSTHKELEAVARYRVAAAAVMLKEGQMAGPQIQEADRLFSALPQNPALLTYRANAILSLAKAYFDGGFEDEALTLLQHSVTSSAPSESRLFAKRFFQLSGDLALKTGNLDQAELAYGDAVEIAESSLRDLKDTRDQMVWAQDNLRLYTRLASVRLRRQDVIGGWSAWETYKAALLPSKSFLAQESPQSSYNMVLHSPLATLEQTVKAASFKLRPRQVLISYAFLPGVITAWGLDSKGNILSVELGADKDLLPRLRKFTEECNNPLSDPKKLQHDAHDLYYILIAPFGGYLANADTLIIETDRDLDIFPFEALIAASGHYLSDEFKVLYSPGIAFHQKSANVHAIKVVDTVLLIGSPAVDAKWADFLPPLPSAELEVRAIAKQFQNPIVLVGKAASYSALEQGLSRAQVLHYAGHSLQTKSGLALALAPDTTLDADKLLLVADLQPQLLRRLQLVVLSACSTATSPLTNADQVAQPFLTAHVPNVLITRWDIDSVQTLGFMKSFYTNLLLGHSPSESLRSSMRMVRDGHLTNHPYYWAAFKLLTSAS